MTQYLFPYTYFSSTTKLVLYKHLSKDFVKEVDDSILIPVKELIIDDGCIQGTYYFDIILYIKQVLANNLKNDFPDFLNDILTNNFSKQPNKNYIQRSLNEFIKKFDIGSKLNLNDSITFIANIQDKNIAFIFYVCEDESIISQYS